MTLQEFTDVQLTDPGNGTARDIGKTKPVYAEVEATVTLTAATDATVRCDASNDGFSTVVQGVPLTVTATGAYVVPAPVGYTEIRPVFVSETGGTDTTVDFVIRTHTT